MIIDKNSMNLIQVTECLKVLQNLNLTKKGLKLQFFLRLYVSGYITLRILA